MGEIIFKHGTKYIMKGRYAPAAPADYLFIHIPRTGGTVVNYTLSGFRKESGGSPIKARIHQSAKWIKKHQYSSWNFAFKFSIVRNPFDWFISLYENVGSNGERRSEYEYSKYGIGAGEKRPNESPPRNFKDWLQYPSVFPHEQDLLYYSNSSILSQSEIVGYELDYIMNFENLKQDFQTLCLLLSNHHGKTLKRELATQVIDPTIRQKNIEDYYDDELIDFINHTYKEDLDRFGYTYDGFLAKYGKERSHKKDTWGFNKMDMAKWKLSTKKY